MIAFRKLGFSALLLTAFAGCGKEPETAAPTPATGTPSATTATPDVTPPVSPAPAPEKATPPAEMPKVEAPQPTPATKDEPKAEAKKSGGQAAAAALSSEEVAEIKKLPADEAQLALKQHVCPVSGENLGAMGKPVKVTAQGQTFYLCCKGCDEDVKADPAAVIAKLKK